MPEECENCFWNDDITGSCTNSEVECVDGSAFVKGLGPEEMFKVLYMLIFSLGGQVDFPVNALEKFDDEMKLELSYDQQRKRYIIDTSIKPAKVFKKKILTRSKKIIAPGYN